MSPQSTTAAILNGHELRGPLPSLHHRYSIGRMSRRASGVSNVIILFLLFLITLVRKCIE
jgi:hypothetical protein